MELIWTDDALEDRDVIFDYIASANPTAALDLDDLFAAGAERLALNPGLGHAGRLRGTREFVVHRHYILIYDIVGDVTRVLRILHTSRQWPPPRV